MIPYSRSQPSSEYDVIRWYTLTPDGNPISWQSSSSSSISTGRSMSGYKNPARKGQIARGENATTPFQASEVVVQRQLGNAVLHSYSFSGGRWLHSKAELNQRFGIGFSAPPSPPSSSLDAEAYSMALVNLYNAIRGAHQSIQGLTFLGELRETLSMIRNPARALRSELSHYLSSAYVRRRRARWRRGVDVAADSWLEWSFGVRPLVNDITDGARALSHLLTQRQHGIVRVGGRGLKEEASMSVQAVGYGSGQFRFLINRRTSLRSAVYLSAGIKVAPLGTANGSRLEELGLNWGSVVPAIWELVPWSFLIDYFTNIGDILGTMAYWNTELAFSSKTTNRVRAEMIYPSWDMSFYPRTATGYYVCTGELGTSQSHNKQVQRSTFVLEIPALRGRLPGFGTRFLNIGALIAGRASDLGRRR